jgi:hypothetical protein
MHRLANPPAEFAAVHNRRGRIYDEVRRRPLYLIHQLHQSEPHRKTMAAAVSEAKKHAEASQQSQPKWLGRSWRSGGPAGHAIAGVKFLICAPGPKSF